MGIFNGAILLCDIDGTLLENNTIPQRNIEKINFRAKGEQIEYLDKRMAEIFRKDGFPQDFVDELIGKVEVVEE